MSLFQQAIRETLEGVIPGSIATLGEDGLPNVTYVSKVFYVDDEHVALSNQFFNKTMENLARNPRAQIQLLHPRDGQHLRLDVELLRREDAGPLFDALKAEIDSIATLFGATGIFRLASADVFRVRSFEWLPLDDEGAGGGPVLP